MRPSIPLAVIALLTLCLGPVLGARAGAAEGRNPVAGPVRIAPTRALDSGPLLDISLAGQTAPSGRPRLAVLPLLHEIPNAGRGIAAILADELRDSGRFELLTPGNAKDALCDKDAWRRLSTGAEGSALDACGLAGSTDYVLAGQIVTLDLHDKDVKLDLGADFRDLSALVGGGNRIAQTVLELHLLRCSDGIELYAGTSEGLESQRGLRMDYAARGWLGSIDFQSDEFRQSMLGRSAYKAVGAAIKEVFTALPLSGEVLAITDAGVVLDLDERSGLAVGDQLDIFHEDALRDSGGSPVWRTQARVGAVQVVAFQPGRCLCLILDGTAQIAEGDIALPLNEPRRLPLETDRHQD